MLVDLVPDFFAACAAPDPVAAYHSYLDRHRPVLAGYWHNYVLDLDAPHVGQIIRETLEADRSDLRRLLDDDRERERMGHAARRRAGTEFSYEVLTARLGAALGI